MVSSNSNQLGINLHVEKADQFGIVRSTIFWKGN